MIVKQTELIYLKNKDHDLAKLINKYGNLSYKSDGNVFAHIVDHIIGQMLSKQAADTIIKRVKSTVDYTPEAILKLIKKNCVSAAFPMERFLTSRVSLKQLRLKRLI